MFGIKHLSKAGFMNTICNLCTYVICKSQINLNCLVICCEIMAAQLRVLFKNIHGPREKTTKKKKEKNKNMAIVDKPKASIGRVVAGLQINSK